MDWNLFWTAFGAIGGVIGAFATTAAVVVALWQTKYSQKKKIKLTFSDNHMLYNQNNGQKIKFVGIRVSNTGNRKIIVSVWGLHMKKNDALVVVPPEVSGLEKLAYAKLPIALELEESVDLLWQMDRFEIVKKELGTYYQEFDSNIEYTIGYLLLKKSEYADIVQMFPALYNIWYIILKDYLEYLGLNEKINRFYQSVKDIAGMPTYVFTTNFDLFAEMLNPQHLHGKFVTKMKTYKDVVYKVINSGENFYFRYIWGHNGIGKMNYIQLFSEYDDHQEYFDFDYFYDEKFEINNMLIYGMGFKKSGYIDDLKMQFNRYEDPVFGGIIDEHVLLRIKGLQTMKRLKHVDVTYFDEEEKIHLEKVLQEVGIEDYGLIKCQDFNFVV